MKNVVKNRVLVTGSTGFVGSSVVRALIAEEFQVVAAVRQLPTFNVLEDGLISWQEVGAIDDCTQWGESLRGVDTVVHCAARAHVMRERAVDALPVYRKVNVVGTFNLAQQAALAGVKRFVFLSSIKVNGESTVVGKPFTEACAPAPEDAYGQSKMEAEQALFAIAEKTDMEVVIIRPPLVYGPGVKGNFSSMLGWVRRGVPLPFGTVGNLRSFVALDNLVSLVILCADCIRSPMAANQVFLVADGEDISTSTLIRKVAKAAGRSSRLFNAPVGLMRAGAVMVGKRALAERLLGNLQVDAIKARTLLGWRPIVSMDDQLVKLFQDK